MDHSSAYGNFSFPYNAQPPRFDMFYEPIPEVFMQPANQAFQQQPPHCFQPYHEQPPLQVQQQLPHGIPASELQGLTTQVVQLAAAVNKLIERVEGEKEASTNEAPLMVAAATEFQEIKCPTTSVTVYSNPSFIDSHSTLNFEDDNSNSLMSDDCMSASVDISECVCEPYDHNYTDTHFEKLVDGFRELAVIHDCNSFVVVPISDFTTASAQLSENVYYDGDSVEPHSCFKEIDCTADLKVESTVLEVQTDFRKSKENLKKIREAADHVLVLQYCEMDFDADVCELEIDFNVLDHMHDVPVEVVDFTPCFDHSDIINSAFSIDRVHIHASSVLDDNTDLNALLDDESDAHDDRYVVFDDVKVDMVDFENACADLGLELELEFAEFLNSVELGNEKLIGCTCLGGGCEICEEINSAICSTSNYFAGAKEEFIKNKLDGNDPDEAASEQRTLDDAASEQRTLDTYILNDLLDNSAFTLESSAKFDDSPMHFDFDLDVAAYTIIADTDIKAVAHIEGKKEVLVDAEEDVNIAQGWNTRSQYLRTEDTAVIADILNAELKEAADLKDDKSTKTFFLDEGGIANSAGSWKELMHILDDHGETPKTWRNTKNNKPFLYILFNFISTCLLFHCYLLPLWKPPEIVYHSLKQTSISPHHNHFNLLHTFHSVQPKQRAFSATTDPALHQAFLDCSIDSSVAAELVASSSLTDLLLCILLDASLIVLGTFLTHTLRTMCLLSVGVRRNLSYSHIEDNVPLKCGGEKVVGLDFIFAYSFGN
ncbi:hypothetical protein LR48_Vigan197s000500 [Vigna angularis]|uniref:Uncharacterized protein n=1 Tax=Phaseolus angularis TaxID=3914 RepID=A0A0L9T662_PHAAN|nr:hypothetical protein LR48_Vigan197s000500 [Vigna angularis]